MDVYLVFIFTVSMANFNSVAASQKVQIQTGVVVGKENYVAFEGVSYTINEFLGIPYAMAPIGDLRFRKPEPVTSLDSPFNATEYGAVCPQVVTGILSEATWKQSEDCLSINLFVPERSPDNSNGHAVMVWIYGGGFIEGSAITYDGKFLAAYGNVIVVTFNYRLNVFGFLSTNDENARGNFGLWDQKMALQWVQDNIGSFGGDNSSVTIFGESSGGISCMTHGLIPDNYGLFQRIISQSGSSTILDYVTIRDGLPEARLVADKVGCNHDTADKIMSCLRTKPWQDILAAATGITPFVPLVDDELIHIDPNILSELSKNTELDELSFYRSLDILNGFNEYDGAMMLLYVTNPSQIENFLPTQGMKKGIMNGILTGLFRKIFPEEILQIINAEYTTWDKASDSHEIRLNIVKLLTDAMFGVPAVEMAFLHKESEISARHYMYLFTPNPPFHVFQTPSWIDGATHADEMAFVFGIEHELPSLSVNSWETQLSRNMIKYWTNFAKTGDPNSPDAVSPLWPEYNLDSQHYMKLGENLTESSVRQYLKAREANFWLNVLPAIEESLQKNQQHREELECEATSAARASLELSVTLYMLCVLSVSTIIRSLMYDISI